MLLPIFFLLIQRIIIRLYIEVHKYRFSGWDVAECGWDVADCVWDLARVWMRSSRVARASDSECHSRNCPGFNPSILRHSGIWGAADETLLNTVHKKISLDSYKSERIMSWLNRLSTPCRWFFLQGKKFVGFGSGTRAWRRRVQFTLWWKRLAPLTSLLKFSLLQAREFLLCSRASRL